MDATATNSNIILLISLQTNGANLWYLKLGYFNLGEIIVWNIKGLWLLVTKGLQNQS